MNDSLSIRRALDAADPIDLATALAIARHSQKSGVFSESVLDLFVAPAFLERRLTWNVAGPSDLLKDLDILANQNQHQLQFSSIRDALQLSMEVLATDPSQLSTQLIGRLSDSEGKYVDQLVDNLRRECPTALHPVRSALIQAADSFVLRRVSDAGIQEILQTQDGKTIAVLDNLGTLQLFDRATMEFRDQIRIPGAVSMIPTDDANRLLVATESGRLVTVAVDNAVRLSDSSSPFTKIEQILRFSNGRALVTHDDGVSVIRLADKVELIRLGADEELRSLSVAVVPEANQIVTGGPEGRVDLWDGNTGKFLRRIGWFGEYREDRMSQLEGVIGAFAESGMWVSIGDSIKRIDFAAAVDQMPGLAEGKRATLARDLRRRAHAHAVTSVAASPNGENFVAATISGELAIWSAGSDTRPQRLEGHESGISNLALSADGRYLVSIGSGPPRVWSIPEGSLLSMLPIRNAGPVTVCITSGNDRVVGGGSDGTLMSWKPELTNRLSRKGTGSSARALSCRAGSNSVLEIRRTGTVTEWSGESGAQLSDSRLTEEEPDGLSVDPTGCRAIAWKNDVVTVYDLATRLPLFRHAPDFDGEFHATVPPLQRDRGIRSGIQHAAVSANGQELLIYWTSEPLGAELTGSGTIRFVSLPSGATHTLAHQAGLVSALAVSPNGRIGVSVSSMRLPAVELDCSLSVWDLPAHSLLTKLRPAEREVSALAFRQGGEKLVWCEGAALRQLSLKELGPAEDLMTLPNPCRKLFISSDDCHAIVITTTDTVELWNLAQRRCLSRFNADQPPEASVLSAAAGYLFVSDKTGGMHILDAHVSSASRRRLDLPADTVSGAGASLAQRLSVLAASETDAALPLLRQIGLDNQSPEVLRIAVGRKLGQGNRRGDATEVLFSVASDRTVSDESRAFLFGVCRELMLPDGVERLLRTPGAAGATSPALLQLVVRGAEWLAEVEHLSTLREVAGELSTPAIHRLVAAEVLAARNDATGAELISGIAESPGLEPDVRLLAWCDLRQLVDSKRWLNAVLQEFAKPQWPDAARLRLAVEIRRVTSISGGILDINRSAALTGTGVLRSANDWNNESMRLGARSDYEGAIEAATKAIRRRPGGARYYHARASAQLGLARITREEKHFALAIDDLSRAIELDPSFGGAWSQRGYAHLESGNYGQALQDIDEAIRIDGPDQAHYRNRSFCLLQLGRFPEAEEDERTADGLPDNDEQRAGISLTAGKGRAGDEPFPSREEIEALRRVAVEGLAKLGMLEPMVQELVGVCRDPLASAMAISEAIIELAGLTAWQAVRSLITETSTALTTRLRAAQVLVSLDRDEVAVEFLTSVAADPGCEPVQHQDVSQFLAAHLDRMEDGVVLRIAGNKRIDTDLRRRALQRIGEHETDQATVDTAVSVAIDRDDAGVVRESCVWMLGDLKSTEGLVRIIRSLSDVSVSAMPAGEGHQRPVRFDVSPGFRVCIVACKQLAALRAEASLHELAGNMAIGPFQEETAAEALVSIGRADLAFPVFLRLGRSRSSPPNVRLLAANSLTRMGQVPEAIRILIDVVRDHDVDKCLREDAGFTLAGLGVFDPGLAEEDDSSIRKANSFEALLEEAKVSFRVARFDDAIAALCQCVEQQPENVNVWYLKGIAHYKRARGKSDAEEALRCFDKCSPSDPAIQGIKARLYSATGDRVRAIDAANRAIEASTNKAEFLALKREIENERGSRINPERT